MLSSAEGGGAVRIVAEVPLSWATGFVASVFLMLTLISSRGLTNLRMPSDGTEPSRCPKSQDEPPGAWEACALFEKGRQLQRSGQALEALRIYQLLVRSYGESQAEEVATWVEQARAILRYCERTESESRRGQ